MTSKFCKKCGTPLSDVQVVNNLSDIENRLEEEKLYEQVATDLKNGIRKEGLYAKALVDANGSEEYAKALYIKYAVQAFKDQIALKEAQDAAIAAASYHHQQLLKDEAMRQQRILWEQQKQLALESLKEFTIDDIPQSVKEKIYKDGYSFLSKLIVRETSTWKDYSFIIKVDRILFKNRENGEIVKEYMF